MTKRHVYREGDRVRIIRSRFIKRVGYALHPNDLRDEMEGEQRYKDALDLLGYGDLKGRAYRKLLDAVCFAEVAKRGMGGKERTLHYYQTGTPEIFTEFDGFMPDYTGYDLTVSGKRCVQTGTYYAPSGGQHYDGEYWNDPGGLTNPKTHVLLNVGIGEIEACDVEPVT